MDEPLLLPVEYQGKALEFEMKIQQGYIHRAEIIIDGIPVIFETDDSGEYRAIVSPEQVAKSKQLSTGLFQAVASQLETLFSGK